jgi:hypothetical protein
MPGRGTGYFDEIAQVVSGGKSSTTALAGSTETEQFRGCPTIAHAGESAAATA